MSPAPLSRLPDGHSWAEVYARPFDDYWYLFWLAAAAYLPVVVLLRQAMLKRKPLSLKPLLLVWNGGLAVLSVAMAAACIPYCVELWGTYEWRESICFNRHYGLHHGTSWAFAWMGYSKVLELFDTVLLALRRKPIILLHWYHHVTVLLFVWYSQVAAQTNAHIVYTLMNCIVHSFMYTYYAFTAVGIFFPFPQALTVMQIVQMVIGAVVVYQSGSCPENAGLYWAGVAMYLSYFVLFLHFFLQKYLTKPNARFTIRQTPSK